MAEELEEHFRPGPGVDVAVVFVLCNDCSRWENERENTLQEWYACRVGQLSSTGFASATSGLPISHKATRIHRTYKEDEVMSKKERAELSSDDDPLIYVIRALEHQNAGNRAL